MECMTQEASVPGSTIKTIHRLLFIVDHSVVEAFVKFWAVFSNQVYEHKIMFSCCGNSIHVFLQLLEAGHLRTLPGAFVFRAHGLISTQQ